MEEHDIIKGLYVSTKKVIPRKLLSLCKIMIDDFESKFECIDSDVHNSSRRVLQFGYEYNYRSMNVKKIEDMPAVLSKIVRYINKNLTKEYNFNQCIINEYKPGQVISPHIDSKVFKGIIACVTLGCNRRIEFSRKDYVKQVVNMADESLYIMTKDARYEWKHRTLRENQLVYSLTFRKV